MSEETPKPKIKPNWLVIALALISSGFVGEYLGFWKIKNDFNTNQAQQIIEELKNDRIYYKELYRECNDKYNLLTAEVSELKSNLQLVNAISQEFPFPVWLKDASGKMLFLNKEYERQFLIPRGLSATDYLNNTDFDVWPKEVAEAYRQNDLEAARSHLPIYTNEMIPNARGKLEKWVVVKYRREINGVYFGIGGFCYKP